MKEEMGKTDRSIVFWSWNKSAGVSLAGMLTNLPMMWTKNCFFLFVGYRMYFFAILIENKLYIYIHFFFTWNKELNIH